MYIVILQFHIIKVSSNLMSLTNHFSIKLDILQRKFEATELIRI